MSNPEITNNNSTQFPVFNALYEPNAIVLFAGADTFAKGVIMGKMLIALGTVTADVGNTGDGTVTAYALSVLGGLAKVGTYNLECITAVTNGGVFKLEDPDGNLVANDITILAGAGGIIVYIGNGMTFTITDAATDFIVGDNFALTITALNKWTIYVAGAADGSGIASGILPVEVVATGAGDLNRAMIIGGEIVKSLVTVDAGGSLPLEAIEQLKDAGIILRDSVILDELDNQ